MTSASDLAARIMAGEGSAEEELVLNYRTGVLIVIRRITGNWALAEDLVQDALQLALEKIRRGDLREPERLSGFICALARNLAIEHYRRASQMEASEDPEAARSVADPGPSPLGHLLRKEKAAMVRRVLAELGSARDREMLYRFYLTEDDKEQICADLGLNGLHFNRVLYRARERFRELYAKTMDKNQG